MAFFFTAQSIKAVAEPGKTCFCCPERKRGKTAYGTLTPANSHLGQMPINPGQRRRRALCASGALYDGAIKLCGGTTAVWPGGIF